MVYMGSKRRLAKDILPIILKGRKDGQAYVEPFCGGCNLIDKVDGIRYANDSNQYLIALLEYVAEGHILDAKPFKWRRMVNDSYRAGESVYEDWEYGYAGFIGSFSGRWNMGMLPDDYRGRNFTKEHCSNINKQAPQLKNIVFSSGSYDEIRIPENSIIYCDAPYKDTGKYKDAIDYEKYYNWLRAMKKAGHTIFVSEYNMPSDFKIIYEKEIISSMRQDIVGKATEKLFTL